MSKKPPNAKKTRHRAASRCRARAAGTAGAPPRGRDPGRRAAPPPAARRAARCRGASGSGGARRPRPRPGAPSGRDRAAPARHAAARPRPLSRARPAGRRAAGRDRAADRARRRFSGSRCPTTPRSIWRCGWCRPIAAPRATADWSMRCCGGSPARAPSIWPGSTPPLLDTPNWLMATLGRGLRDRDRARDRGRAFPRAGARSHGQAAIRPIGPPRWAAACCRPGPCGRWCMGRCRGCPDITRAPGGCRTRPRRCRRGCSATSPARRWPICARRPAARPRSSPLAGARVVAVDRAPARIERVRRQSQAARPHGRDRHRRHPRPPTCRQLAGEPVRRRPARCALLVDRHHPAPSGRALAQAAGATSRRWRRCSARCSRARSS